MLRKTLELESGDSLKLSASPGDNPICAISVDTEVPAIVVVWKRYATSLQLRFIHEYILYLIKAHGIGKILGDDTSLATIHLDDREWIVRDWMPRAVAAGLRFAASKSPNSYFGNLSVNDVKVNAPASLVLRSFESLTAARSWLSELR